jgi:hypothetical protein
MLNSLCLAVETGDVALVQELLNSGANFNSPPSEVWGATTLQVAAWWDCGRIGIIALLQQIGADVNALSTRRDKITALRASVHESLVQVFQSLNVRLLKPY